MADAERGQLGDKTGGLVLALVKGLVATGNLDSARELVQRVRIACDEATALINDAARKPAELDRAAQEGFRGGR